MVMNSIMFIIMSLGMIACGYISGYNQATDVYTSAMIEQYVTYDTNIYIHAEERADTMCSQSARQLILSFTQ